MCEVDEGDEVDGKGRQTLHSVHLVHLVHLVTSSREERTDQLGLQIERLKNNARHGRPTKEIPRGRDVGLFAGKVVPGGYLYALPGEATAAS